MVVEKHTRPYRAKKGWLARATPLPGIHDVPVARNVLYLACPSSGALDTRAPIRTAILPLEMREENALQTVSEAAPYAFEVLVQRYRRPVLKLAYRITGDAEDAADIAQEVFARAFTRLADRKPEPAFAGWLTVVTRNAALDCLRRRSVRHKHSADSSERSERGPEELALLEDAADRVYDALRGLPKRYRDVLELYYFQGLTYREIGERLRMPLGTVKTFLFRALRSLRTVASIAHLRDVA